MADKKEKEPMNFVHKNAILCETVTKENRTQKLYTNYSINPFKTCKYNFAGIRAQGSVFNLSK